MLVKSANIPGFDDSDSDGVNEEPEAKETVVVDRTPNAGESYFEA